MKIKKNLGGVGGGGCERRIEVIVKMPPPPQKKKVGVGGVRSEKTNVQVPTWSDTNQAVQLQKMARGLKYLI